MMRRVISLAAAVVLLGVVGIAPTMAKKPWPTPPIVNRGWHITFSSHLPQRLLVANSRRPSPAQTLWFIRYTVTNSMERDLYFNPRFELIADNGKIIRPLASISPGLLEHMRLVTGDPFIIDPALVIGRLLQGPDNARDSVVVFADIPETARGFRVFVAGLSGAMATQMDPLTHKPVVLHETLVLHYWIPGRAIHIRPRARLLDRRWVMR